MTGAGFPSAAQLRAQFQAGEITPTEVIEETLHRIDALDDPAILLSVVDRETSQRAAERLHRRDLAELPLFGIPFVVKDNIDIAGVPTTAACRSFAHVAARSALVIERLIAAGAIPVAKANLDQFATGLAGTRSPFGIPSNTVDTGFVPGGSSSGSAVSVARGLTPFALGTDTAGSGRVPASFNRIVGLKPTPGLVSNTGVVPAIASLDCVSVFARTIDDAELVFRVMADQPLGTDAGDRFVARTIAVPSAPGLEPCDPGTIAAHRSAIEIAAALGHHIVEVDIEPLLEIGRLLYAPGPWLGERYASFGAHLESNPEDADPTVAAIVLGARSTDPETDARALRTLGSLAPAALRVLQGADALLLPTTPSIPTLREGLSDQVGTSRVLGTYTNFVNLLGLSALTVPGPDRPLGLPAGVMLVGGPSQDQLLAEIGRGLMAFLSRRADDVTVTSDGVDAVEISVVGAHLGGLPLNHQLTDRGARFVRATSTSPEYRLFALADSLPPNAGPARPGLIRVASGTGRSIATEIWRIPTGELGSFMTGIPSPLGLGTVRLRDGSSTIGFMCEGIATDGAVDLTGFGGWRAWIAEGSPVD